MRQYSLEVMLPVPWLNETSLFSSTTRFRGGFDSIVSAFRQTISSKSSSTYLDTVCPCMLCVSENVVFGEDGHVLLQHHLHEPPR